MKYDIKLQEQRTLQNEIELAIKDSQKNVISMEYNNKEEQTDANKWQNIDWKKVNSEIASMQDNLVKLVINKRSRSEIYNAQRKLIESFAARAMAVRKVITNAGRKTAGVDGITLNNPGQYYRAIDWLNKTIRNPKNYQASPIRRVLIPKGNGEKRPLGIPTINDRIVQAIYLLAVDPIVEQTSDRNSFGFRKERSTIDAVINFRNYMDKKVSPEWILEADISKCFDRISHEWLLENTPICDKNILKQWLKSGVMHQGKLSATELGTPQGSIISPTLANIALNGLEDYVKKAFPRNDADNPKVKVIRYADDVVITGKNREILLKCKTLMEKFIAERGLQLNQTKTKITNIHEGIDFLGFNIIKKPWRRGLNRKSLRTHILIIRPTSKGITKVIGKIRDAFKRNKKMTDIIIELNPILRGWCEHKRISWHSTKAFSKLNLILWNQIRSKFVKRKAKTTSMRRNYRKIRLSRGWGDKNGRKLFDPAQVKTVKVRAKKTELNPYLLEHQEYFKARKDLRLLNKLKERLFVRYKGICVVCEQKLNNGEKVEIHHIKPKKLKGTNSIRNLQPLHRLCHIKITHQNNG